MPVYCVYVCMYVGGCGVGVVAGEVGVAAGVGGGGEAN